MVVVVVIFTRLLGSAPYVTSRSTIRRLPRDTCVCVCVCVCARARAPYGFTPWRAYVRVRPRVGACVRILYDVRLRRRAPARAHRPRRHRDAQRLPGLALLLWSSLLLLK